MYFLKRLKRVKKCLHIESLGVRKSQLTDETTDWRTPV